MWHDSVEHNRPLFMKLPLSLSSPISSKTHCAFFIVCIVMKIDVCTFNDNSVLETRTNGFLVVYFYRICKISFMCIKLSFLFLINFFPVLFEYLLMAEMHHSLWVHIYVNCITLLACIFPSFTVIILYYTI